MTSGRLLSLTNEYEYKDYRKDHILRLFYGPDFSPGNAGGG
jgi:hypothetical protein